MYHSWRSHADYSPRSPSFNILKYPSSVQQHRANLESFFYQLSSLLRLKRFFYCPLHAIAFARIRYRTITSEVCRLIAKWKEKAARRSILSLAHKHNDFPGALRWLTKTSLLLRKQVASRRWGNGKAASRLAESTKWEMCGEKNIPKTMRNTATYYRKWRTCPHSIWVQIEPSEENFLKRALKLSWMKIGGN